MMSIFAGLLLCMLTDSGSLTFSIRAGCLLLNWYIQCSSQHISHACSYTVSWYSYSSLPLCEIHRIIALMSAHHRHYPRNHDPSIHAHVRSPKVDVVRVEVLHSQDSLDVSRTLPHAPSYPPSRQP